MKKSQFILLAAALTVLVILSSRQPAFSESDPTLEAGFLPPPPHERAQAPRFPGAPAPSMPSPPSPQQPRVPWSKIVYQWLHGDGNDDFNIYIASDDGANPRALTDEPGHEVEPDLNRGATRIVYSASSGSQPYHIYMMNVDGSGKTVLANEGNNRQPTWSPDGSKILFSSDRGGQWDLYIMNADGSEQRALAPHPGYDGMPSWSPNGQRIAFSSTRSGAQRIWLVDADGSDLTMLNNLPYGSYPRWSPDGKKVAFSAGASDEWLDLYVSNIDGSGALVVAHSFSSGIDQLASGWSPDGRYVTYTTVRYTTYQGQLYWYSSNLGVVDVEYRNDGGDMFSVASRSQWHPSWATTDVTPPTVNLSALPSVAAARFPVRWSGADTGPAGLRDFELQARVGPAGAWNTWLETAATEARYSDAGGGQQVEFRARSRDRAFNYSPWSPVISTRVENLPPELQLAPLPHYQRADEPIMLTWQGHDPGDSGIAHYDLQIQIDGGPWNAWQTAITPTHAIFTDTIPGAQIGFRLRAADRAGNVIPWSGAPQAHTTFYSWAVQGAAYDNGGAAISGVQPVAPAAFASESESSHYAAYFDSGLSEAALSWQHDDYGPLPATLFTAGPDAYQKVIMPPADNLVSDWGFESGAWGNGWQSSGALPAVIGDEILHSGQYAAVLGLQNGSPEAQELLIGDDQYSYQFEYDARGVGHLLYRYFESGGHTISYRQLQPDGAWSAPEVVGADGSDALSIPIFMSTTADGEVHAFWQELIAGVVHIRYRMRTPSGQWSARETVTTTDVYSHQLNIAVDEHRNIVHLAFADLRSGASDPKIYYMNRRNGEWTSPQRISALVSTNAELRPRGMVLGHDGSLHLVYRDFYIWYRRRSPAGAWQTPVRLADSFFGETASLALGPDDNVHITWVQNRYGYYQEPGALWHVERSADGHWSKKEVINQGVPVWTPLLVPGPDGVVHAVWGSGWQGLTYMWRNEQGQWSYPHNYRQDAVFEGYESGLMGFTLAVDAAGAAHLAWAEVGDSNSWQWRVFHAVRRPGEQLQHRLLWQGQRQPAGLSATLSLGPLDHNNALLLWNLGGSGPLQTSLPLTATETGAATISTTVTIPAHMAHPLLSFLYDLSGVTHGETLRVNVVDGAQQTTVYEATEAAGWKHAHADLSPWRGRTIDLSFTVEEVAGTLPTLLVVDEVTVGTAYPDTWLTLSSVGPARSGQAIVYDISYGNQGAVAAAGSQLRLTLPAGVSFVAASQQPHIDGQTLTWTTAALAAHSPHQRITVTAMVAPHLQPGAVLLATAALPAYSQELETANNNASLARTVTPHTIWLPGLFYIR